MENKAKMDISPQIESVYQRALWLRQRASELPMQPDLVEVALAELYNVLEELQSSEEELQQQNQALLSAHQRLELERQSYQDLFNQAPDGYLVTDIHGKIRAANLAIAAMLNVSPQFLIGKPLVIFIAQDTRPTFYLELDRLQQISRIQDWQLRLCPRRGVPFDVSITVTVVRNPAHQQIDLRWLLRDTTERQQVNLILERLNAELEHQVKERTFQLQQMLNFEAGLKRITDKVRDSLDENYILQSAVQELTLVLGIICCDTAAYDLGAGTSTVRYQYTATAEDLVPEEVAPSSFSAQGQIVPMSTFSEGYQQLLQISISSTVILITGMLILAISIPIILMP
ncbi:MAG: PAS domain-containing protein [Leptolyngbyaceae cyanobacterium CRU_2_3]|nr:PAS domain-containing protein [Leptolyngbyaceae cyanobacterium CRU_2_3]